MLSDLLVCGYIVFHEVSSICCFLCSTFGCGSFVFSMTLVCGFHDPSCNTIVSLLASVVFGYM